MSVLFAVEIFTSHNRRLWEGNIFTLFVSSGGRGPTPAHWSLASGPRSFPGIRGQVATPWSLFQGVLFRRRGGGYPWLGEGGIAVRSPLARTRTGVLPLPPARTRTGVPPHQTGTTTDRIRHGWYTSCAFTQEDFLVSLGKYSRHPLGTNGTKIQNELMKNK